MIVSGISNSNKIKLKKQKKVKIKNHEIQLYTIDESNGNLDRINIFNGGDSDDSNRKE